MSSAVLALLLALAQFSQARTGELRLTVVDSEGLPLVAHVELTSDATDFRDVRDRRRRHPGRPAAAVRTLSPRDQPRRICHGDGTPGHCQ